MREFNRRQQTEGVCNGKVVQFFCLLFFFPLASYKKRIATCTGLQCIAAESDLCWLYNRIYLDINVRKASRDVHTYSVKLKQIPSFICFITLNEVTRPGGRRLAESLGYIILIMEGKKKKLLVIWETPLGPLFFFFLLHFVIFRQQMSQKADAGHVSWRIVIL